MVEAVRPDTLVQALNKLAVGRHTLFAGGTDLMAQHNVRTGVSSNFRHDVIFVDAIQELTQVVSGEDNLIIGAAVTLHEIEAHPLVPEILRQSVAKIAAPAIRNRATMVGNICNASPAADSLPALYLLNARVVLSSVEGEREMALEEFILAPGRTQLKHNEMLTYVLIPHFDLPITFYHKVGTRAANALSKLSVAGLAKVEGNKLLDWRVAFGAVGPTVVRCKRIESLLTGIPVNKLSDQALLDEIIYHYSKAIAPKNDQRSTAEYRHRASLNLLRRWLSQIPASV
jgi:CO/xanthine dehydrogenase FAD-binding subunit